MLNPTGVSTVIQWQGGEGEGRRFSYLLESHMTYLAGSHILRSWPGIQLIQSMYVHIYPCHVQNDLAVLQFGRILFISCTILVRRRAPEGGSFARSRCWSHRLVFDIFGQMGESINHTAIQVCRGILTSKMTAIRFGNMKESRKS